jgi:hypothetical protein
VDAEGLDVKRLLGTLEAILSPATDLQHCSKLACITKLFPRIYIGEHPFKELGNPNVSCYRMAILWELKMYAFCISHIYSSNLTNKYQLFRLNLLKISLAQNGKAKKKNCVFPVA